MLVSEEDRQWRSQITALGAYKGSHKRGYRRVFIRKSVGESNSQGIHEIWKSLGGNRIPGSGSSNRFEVNGHPILGVDIPVQIKVVVVLAIVPQEVEGREL